MQAPGQRTGGHLVALYIATITLAFLPGAADTPLGGSHLPRAPKLQGHSAADAVVGQNRADKNISADQGIITRDWNSLRSAQSILSDQDLKRYTVIHHQHSVISQRGYSLAVARHIKAPHWLQAKRAYDVLIKSAKGSTCIYERISAYRRRN